MGKKKKPEDPGPGVPEWIVTFSDMISLLVTFFVLLMTFSSMEVDDVIRVKGAMVGMRGALNEPIADAISKPPADLVDQTDPIRGLRDRHSRPPEELPEELSEYGEAKQEDQVEIDLSKIGDGMRIAFSGDCYFAPGSAEPPPDLVERAAELAEVLSHYPYMLLVEGYTDDAFKPSLRYPDAESLALARAAAVADVMTGMSDLEPMKVLVAGPGSARPVADNDTAYGRRLNRRVEVRVLTLSKARTTFLDSARQSIESGDLQQSEEQR